MIEFTLQLLSLVLVAVGLIFIWMEELVRFDRTFLHLGIALVLFGCIPGIDIWIIPGLGSADQLLLWTRVKHIFLLFLFPAILWYLNNVFKFNLGYLLHFVVTLMVFFLPLFFSNAAMSVVNGKIAYGPLYNFLFLPCAVIAGGLLVGLIASKLKGAQGNERHILFYHLVGITLLCAFGVIDLIVGTLNVASEHLFPNYFILGVFALGLMSFFIFTERLLMLIKDRRATYNQLQIALREMDEASTLRQIGESTSIINHEIKNYLVAISGSAELIKLTENLTEDGKQSVAVIMKTINDLQNFNKDVLQLSRARIIMEKERLVIGPLIDRCIADFFSDRRKQISIAGGDQGFTLHGNWSKLEHVFVNIFKNAFEAGATSVLIHLTSTKYALLITIIDNGSGCTPEQLPSMFKPFYTTKKGRQGTGLGMAISRAVIESHGGHITAYTRNGLMVSHGMQLNISLPQFTDDPKPPDPGQAPIVLVKNGFENPGALLQVFSNVNIFPYTVQSVEDLNKIKNIGFMAIVAAEETFKALHKNERIKQELLVLVSRIDGIYYAKNVTPHIPLTLFSEDLVVELNEALAK
jgi:signal transduction histidine kinase